MELSPVKIVWGDYENETLIHNHKMAKLYKKRYQRASDLYNSLFSFFGLITVVSSSIATTLSWGSGDDISPNQQIILSGFTTVSALSAAIQNFYKFQENSEVYTITAKSYAKLQNKIEGVGNINPKHREVKPQAFLKKTQDRFDQISDTRIEISNCMTNCFYKKEEDDDSYLEDKHQRYKTNLDDEDTIHVQINDN